MAITFCPINTTSKFGPNVLNIKAQCYNVEQSAYNSFQLAISMTDFVAPGTSGGGGTAITAASWSTNVVTFTVANSFVAGQVVVVGGMTPNAYNGVYTVVSASGSQFTAVLTSNPGAETGLGYAGVVSWTNVETYYGVNTGLGLEFFNYLAGIGNASPTTNSNNPTGAPLGSLFTSGITAFVNSVG